jgi:hypothetical protein
MGSYMQVLQLLWDPICGYCNECKKLATIMGSYMRVLQ